MYLSNISKFIAILSTVFLSGCVGLGVGILGNDEHNLKNPHIQLSKDSISSTEGITPWITSEDLRRYWGPPDSVEHLSGGNEQWQYNFGRRWNGIGLLVAFVPLPLMIPVGHEYIRFTIEEGQVVEATTKEDYWIAMYGCVASGIMHAVGADCTFGRQSHTTRFINDSQLLKISFTNAMNKELYIVQLYNSDVKPITLAPGETRIILRYFFGGTTIEWGDTAIKDKEGKTLATLGRTPSANTYDSTISYLIIDNHAFPIPPKYWGSWEDHIKEITKSEEPSK